MSHTPTPHRDRMTWHKSTYSGGSGSECVEVAQHPAGLLIRDSKDPSGPVLDFPAASWSAFVAHLKNSQLPG